MNTVPHIVPAVPDTSEALAVIDRLRADVEAGRVLAFVCAAVAPDDQALGYASSTVGVSRLRMQGAMAQALHNFLSGEL